MAIYPGAISSFAGFTSGHTLAADSHASQHNSEQAEISATQTKVGTGSSTPTASTILRGTGPGTSSWAQVTLTTDVTGVLPIANGGTGAASGTGSGSPVFATSPTIATPTLTTPTIADFTNATHDHSTNAKGGKITSTAITSFDTSLTAISNPYKFSAYRSAALNSPNNTTVVLAYDTKLYDTNNNFDVTTNKGRYTAPVSGFYYFCGGWGKTNSAVDSIIMLYKNGVELRRWCRHSDGSFEQISGSSLEQATAGDYFEVNIYTNAVIAVVNSIAETYFSGYLVSTT